MAFVPGFENDVFISYAHADNEVDVFGDAWVDKLAKYLGIALKQRLGRADEVRIFFDSKRLRANHHLEEILDNVRGSAVFLAIGSPSYINRQWTRDELSTFVETAGEPRRLFAIERLPLDSGDRYPDPLDDYYRINFWQRDPADDIPLTVTQRLNSDLYYVLLQKLAEQIRSQLVAMHKQSARPAAAPAASVPASPAVDKDPDAKTVLVAQVTEDLEAEREQMVSYLDQCGIPNLPTDFYPQGSANFQAAVAEDLGRSALFVQLLGTTAGRRPRDMPEGYLAAQYRLAEEAGVKILQWRSPDIADDAVSDENHRTLLFGEKVAAIGFESFKANVRKLATEPPPAPPEAEEDFGDAPIFINADLSDQPVAETLFEKIRGQDVPVMLSQPHGDAKDVRQDLERSWRECGAVLLIYGAAKSFWVRNQIMLYNKLKRQREKPPRVFKILNCPPAEKPSLGIALPGVDEIDCRAGLSPEVVDSVVLELAS
ncbi:toll/interleukin-1 receptor domain-containing protein [Bauldia sp.]|uniref:toll/interleukin-1 receptor domain-containing protein n=1 Tax=Bauldia sp. TaxID=2575872 RepID=UPI003BADAFC6